jgi:hypothetical protein
VKYGLTLVSLLVAAFAVAPVWGEEAGEVSPELSRVVSRVNEWMTTPQSSATPEITAKATVSSLDRTTRSDASSMASRLVGARLVAIAVYHGKPTTLAGDVSRQLRGVEDIPEEKRRPLLVEASKVARANDVAAKWADELLECNDRDSVAVSVYWFADDRTHSLMSGSEPEPRLYMVLTRFTHGSESPYAIARIAWGPVAESRPRDAQSK